MNSIVLSGEVFSEPELRYTPENLAVTSLLLRFPSLRPEEPPYQVRVSAFGELAQKVAEGCHVGDQVTVEGQLHMNVVERDGRKEKLAEITARHIYLGSGRLQSLADRGESPAGVGESGTESFPDLDEIPF